MNAMIQNEFSRLFLALTGTGPFPWQQSLYEKFIHGEIPSVADLPTGLGKTSVVAIWLIAFITHPDLMPRRLVYVVNRRTVVDQTTSEVEKLRERLCQSSELVTELNELKRRCAIDCDTPLALSTLRGQFADNREWCADPARPAVIVGTVDMIGSSLLFSRYSCGFKTRPHHAALLGQDALLIHDEAHLEPAFQKLLDEIVVEQTRCKDAHPLRVLGLSATTRDASSAFVLTPEDEIDERVKKRLFAPKGLVLHPIDDEKKQLAEKLATIALARRDSGRAVLVYARAVDVVQRVAEALEKQKLPTVILTGTMRGKERDELVDTNPKFLRFLPKSSQPDNSLPTVYLVATSAGEVGVNISADDLICDLSTYESLAQRFGRVNRFGDTKGTTIDLVHPATFDESDPRDFARARTLELLRQLAGDASLNALRKLDSAARSAAFSPLPEIRPATDILFDAWSLTSIRNTLPGRPPVAPYLHGEPPEGELPETYVAWRLEVDKIKDNLLDYYPPQELIEDCPLKPHELLRDRSFRVSEQLARIADRVAKNSGDEEGPTVWLIDDDGRVDLVPISSFADKETAPHLDGRTVLLPPSLGGLSENGLLDGKAEPSGDSAEDVSDKTQIPVRKRLFTPTQKVPDDNPYSHWRIVRVIDLWCGREEVEDGSGENRYWLWLEAPAASDVGGVRKAGKSVSLADHSCDVEGHAAAIVEKLNLPQPLARCVVLSARFHDLGKRRRRWQRGIGNHDETIWLAKTGGDLLPRAFDEAYRHEFGSLRDAQLKTELKELGLDERDLVLHLIAAHHGRARPHFPIEEAFDPEGNPTEIDALAVEVPRRFARLQRRFGRWGLAYLESLLRAADYAASAGIPPRRTL